MIRINLHDTGKKKKSQERSIILILSTMLPTFIIVLVIFLILMFMQMRRENLVNELRRRESRIEEKVNDIRPEVTLSREEIEDLEYKKNVINVLMGKDRLSWTDNLQMIARVIPNNVFMYRLDLTEQTEQRVRRTGSDQRTEPVINYNLRLEGFAKAEDMDKELKLIAAFINSLRANTLFQRNFHPDIRFSSTEKVAVANEVVSLFVLNLTPQPPQ